MSYGTNGNTDESECAGILHNTLDRGINFMDTADTYSHGESEELFGTVIEGRRGKVVLPTRFRLVAGEGSNEQGGSRHWFMKQVENSLRELKTDHIDLYQMHLPYLQTDLEEKFGALKGLVTRGKARYIGCSTTSSWDLAETQSVSRANKTARFINESSSFSIYQRVAERETLPALEHYRMGPTAWSALNGGWFTGKYKADGSVPSALERGNGQWGQHYPILKARFDMTSEGSRPKPELTQGPEGIASEAGVSLMYMAHTAVTSVILGLRTLDQINDLVPPGSLIDEADRGCISP